MCYGSGKTAVDYYEHPRVRSIDGKGQATTNDKKQSEPRSDLSTTKLQHTRHRRHGARHGHTHDAASASTGLFFTGLFAGGAAGGGGGSGGGC